MAAMIRSASWGVDGLLYLRSCRILRLQELCKNGARGTRLGRSAARRRRASSALRPRAPPLPDRCCRGAASLITGTSNLLISHQSRDPSAVIDCRVLTPPNYAAVLEPQLETPIELALRHWCVLAGVAAAAGTPRCSRRHLTPARASVVPRQYRCEGSDARPHAAAGVRACT